MQFPQYRHLKIQFLFIEFAAIAATITATIATAVYFVATFNDFTAAAITFTTKLRKRLFH